MEMRAGGPRASPHFWAIFLFVLSANGYFPAITSSAPWQSGGGGTGRVGTEADHLSCLLLSPLTPPVGGRRFGPRSLISGTRHVHLHVLPDPLHAASSWLFRATLFNAHNLKRTTGKSFRGNTRKGESGLAGTSWFQHSSCVTGKTLACQVRTTHISGPLGGARSQLSHHQAMGLGPALRNAHCSVSGSHPGVEVKCPL